MWRWSTAILYPTVKVLRRTGHQASWAILAIVPLMNIVGLWLLAFSRWPAVDGQPSAA